MAVERPIYSIKPEESKQPEELSLGSVGCVTIFAAGVFGGGSGLIWGTEVGLKVGIGMSGFIGGMLLGLPSADRAEKFAKQGRQKRAYVEALRSLFETAIGLAIGGITAGGGIAGTEGAFIGGGVGVLIGVGGGQTAFSRVSRALRDRGSA